MKTIEKNQIFIYILASYFFSVLIRLIWVYQFQGTESFMWNNQLMINTNDGYVFAEKARDVLNGSIGYLDAVNNDGAVGFLTALFTKILPFSFETIILYMPTFLGSLLVVPLVLIGYTLKRPQLGFMAALFGAIVWSYYNRTMTGYYDSDMLNIVMPMLVFWALIHAITVQKDRYLLLLIIFMVLSQWWYPKNIALNSAMIFMSVIYLFLKDKNNIFNFKLIAFSLIGLAIFSFDIKIILIVLLFSLFHFQKDLVKKYIYAIVAIAGILYLYSGAFNSILSSLELYLVNRFFPPESVGNLNSLHFYGVINTVREASAIPFETFANRISGHVITFVLATVGVILMMIRYPILLISLPMVGMGFMAYKSGLRFTVYAVPIYALGLGYIFFFLRDQVADFIQDKNSKKIFSHLFVPIMTVAVLIPNIQHIISYKVPTVLNKQEVKDLSQLDKISSSKDYTLAWWDYGYPIRYYSDTNTLIDGGKHQNDNYIISKIMLTSSQNLASNLSRLSVETYEKTHYAVVANTLFKSVKPKRLLAELKTSDYNLPQKSRDIYLYLPYRMLNIFPTVSVFGNINLKTGNPSSKIMFYPTRPIQEQNGVIVLQNGIIFDTLRGEVKIGNKTKKVKNFDIAVLGENSMPSVRRQLAHLDGEVSIVYLKSYGQMIVMDNKTYASTYVQMFMLGEYNKSLFELVVSSPYSKIYKLKK